MKKSTSTPNGWPNWSNRTLWTGDNLDIMRGMNSASVDLIYLDPPFNSNKNYAAPIGSEAAGAAFKDTWTLNDVDEAWHGEIADRNPTLYTIIDAAGLSSGKHMKSYLIMMAVRLLEMKRILKETGSIYLHCDPTASHYLKCLMDAVLGKGNFRNEIIWKRTSSHNRAKRWGPIHDTIFFYVRGSAKSTWNRVLQPLEAKYIDKQYRFEDERGRYRLSDLTGPGERDGDTGNSWKGIDPSAKDRHWEVPPDRALPSWFVMPKGYSEMTATTRLGVLDAQGLIDWPKRGRMPSFKRYLTEGSGAPIQDVIQDIPPLSASELENVDYPTQKPLKFLERILKASSNEGDIVLDPFCGCATACVAAEKLGRKWIAIDLSPKAADLVKTRLRKEMGVFYEINHRRDIPARTDQGEVPNYKTHRHTLYGIQEGVCAGCRQHFLFRNMTVDHVVPKSKGGTDHITNLQLLCAACNSLKGSRSQEEFLAVLKRERLRR